MSSMSLSTHLMTSPFRSCRNPQKGTQLNSEKLRKAPDLIQLVFIIKGLEKGHVRTLYRTGERRGSLLKGGERKETRKIVVSPI